MKIQRQKELFAFVKFIREANFSWEQQGPEEYARRQKALNALHFMASKLGIDSQSMYGHPQGVGGGYLYSPEREGQHKEAQRFFWDTGGPENLTKDEYGNQIPHGADSIPDDGSVYFMAGPGGSGKSTILGHPDIQRIVPQGSHFRWNADPFKYWMGYNNMIPSLEETLKALEGKGVAPEMTQKIFRALGGYASPMDMSPLVHEEASEEAKKLLGKLRAEHKSVILDATLGSSKSAFKHLGNFKASGYNDPSIILVNAMLDTQQGIKGANDRARGRYKRGDEDHRSGRPEEDWEPFFPGVPSPGGRFISDRQLGSNSSKVGGRSSSEDTFRAIAPFLSNTLETDARRNLDKEAIQNGMRVLVSGGSGPIYQDYDWDHGVSDSEDIYQYPNSMLIDPHTGEPFQKAGINWFHYAFNEMEGENNLSGGGMDKDQQQRQILWDKLMEDYYAGRAGSVEEIVERYGEGEFDFDTLVSLIKARSREVQARRLQERAKMSFEEQEFERWHDSASTPDDVGVVLAVAVHKGILSEEEERAIMESLV